MKEGINQNDEVIKKYGHLERSFDFTLTKSIEVPFAEIKDRHNESCISDVSHISGMSLFSSPKGTEISSNTNKSIFNSGLSNQSSNKSVQSGMFVSKVRSNVSSSSCSRIIGGSAKSSVAEKGSRSFSPQEKSRGSRKLSSFAQPIVYLDGDEL